MKAIRLIALLLSLSAFTFAGVTVSSPSNGENAGSPVHFVANASSTHPISAIMVYVDNKTAYTGVAGVAGRNLHVVEGSAVEIQVETWIFNFGPNQLMEKVRFEDGIVASVESMGYGYNEP